MFTTFLLGAAAASPTCVKLQKDFDDNERAMAIIHDLNRGFYDVDLTFSNTVGTTPPTERLSLEKSRRRLKYDDEEHLGRRLISAEP
jgi:hypothetical protein